MPCGAFQASGDGVPAKIFCDEFDDVLVEGIHLAAIFARRTPRVENE